MTNTIHWVTDFNIAKDMADKGGIPILLDFFNPG